MSVSTPPRISVVIPTFERRDLVTAAVRSLGRQQFGAAFEVIVVVDGSSDGSADALRALDVDFPLTVLEQSNEGASGARNNGAARARGDILLFIDDDMEAHPRLLAEHDGSHRESADAVLGHVPLHPQAPRNLLSRGVKQWADARLIRLVGTPPSQLPLQDLLTGQISVRREVFEAVGGFNRAFTRGGSFGNEDIDFGYRLIRGGYKVVFNANAITRQNYIVGPRAYLRQWRQAGQADVAFVRMYPEHRQTLFNLTGRRNRASRWLWRPAAGSRLAPATALLRAAVLALFPFGTGYGWISCRISSAFFAARKIEYWKGVQEAGGIPGPHPVRVLCYHAIEDLRRDPKSRAYGVPPAVFGEQMSLLRRAGYHFITADELVRYVRGEGGLPANPVLLTFDDGLRSVLAATPTLREHSIPAVVFVVSGQIGGTNAWDRGVTTTTLDLLDRDQLAAIAAAGVEIGCHSRSHASLPTLDASALAEEIEGSVAELRKAGFAARLLAYPYGEHDARVRAAVAAAGLDAAFTVTAGCVAAGDDPYQLQRIEIRSSDTGGRFLRKVRTAREDGAPRADRIRTVVRRSLHLARPATPLL